MGATNLEAAIERALDKKLGLEGYRTLSDRFAARDRLLGERFRRQEHIVNEGFRKQDEQLRKIIENIDKQIAALGSSSSSDATSSQGGEEQ
jgi:hypothetical protein